MGPRRSAAMEGRRTDERRRVMVVVDMRGTSSGSMGELEAAGSEKIVWEG
jgi:hypothetical protein